ncbi:hypothetical protein EFK69_08135 [Lactococcus lactis subsp. lactis]|nr:hypothetical protein [Lactococcus lactis subsp. lactis]
MTIALFFWIILGITIITHVESYIFVTKLLIPYTQKKKIKFDERNIIPVIQKLGLVIGIFNGLIFQIFYLLFF